MNLIHLIPRWSDLRKLGQSNLLALTIFAPLIGWLIIFNNKVIDLLFLSSSVFGSAAGDLTIGRIKLVYFGLFSLGISSFLFRLFCPDEIQEFSSQSKFIDGESSLITQARVTCLIQKIIDLRKNLEYQPDSYAKSEFHLYETFDSIFKDAEIDIDVVLSESTLAGDDISERIISMTGNLILDNFIEILSKRIRAQKWLWEPFEVTAKNYWVDILNVYYIELDYHLPVIRAIISIFYFLGFSLLFYPSLVTFLQIFSGLIN